MILQAHKALMTEDRVPMDDYVPQQVASEDVLEDSAMASEDVVPVDVEMARTAFGHELDMDGRPHRMRDSECNTSFTGSRTAYQGENFSEVVQEDVNDGYGTLDPVAHCGEGKCIAEVWYAHEPGSMHVDGHRDSCNGQDQKIRLRCKNRRCKEVSNSDNRRENAEIGRSFQLAVGAHDWNSAENLIPHADLQRLNDGLCIVLDSVWFLCTRDELCRATKLIEKLVEAGAQDFTRAALRTSFLASCVSACRSRTMSLADTVMIMAQRLQERLQECSGDEMLNAEAAVKVRRFTEWALKCIGSHSRARSGDAGEEVAPLISSIESQLQLKVFKRFLELAGNRLSGKDYTEAFDAACFPLTLFSTAIESGGVSTITATAMQGLLGMLVEGGADNVNQCFLEAARFGSTELVRILLQIAQRNGIEVDVDLALGFASHYCKISTMDCLVSEGNAVGFLGPLMRAADRGSMQVVKWFVDKGCQDMELCLALTAAASSSKIEVAAYLLKHIPISVLRALSLDILKAGGERSTGSLQGISFLLKSDWLQSPDVTYAVADSMAKLEDEAISAELKQFFREEWSEDAFLLGRMVGEAHHVNVMRAIKRGSFPLCLDELPSQLQVAIAYAALYKECVNSRGILVSQWHRGQLVEAALRLGGGKHSSNDLLNYDKEELLGILESRLPSFLLRRG